MHCMWDRVIRSRLLGMVALLGRDPGFRWRGSWWLIAYKCSDHWESICWAVDHWVGGPCQVLWEPDLWLNGFCSVVAWEHFSIRPNLTKKIAPSWKLIQPTSYTLSWKHNKPQWRTFYSRLFLFLCTRFHAQQHVLYLTLLPMYQSADFPHCHRFKNDSGNIQSDFLRRH